MYDTAAGRYQIVDGAGEVQHPGLHCGECFSVRLLDGWQDTRIEYGRDGWWLDGTPFRGVLENLYVRYGR